MQRWKKRVGVGLFGLLAALGVLYALGFFDPRPDPAFAQTLANSAPEDIEPLIEAEAQRLGISALSVYASGGKDPGETMTFGRARQDGVMQAASLSKAVAAAVILSLAERENVPIDADIRGQITSLDIASLEGGDRPVSLRQLLSHTSGSSQSGYPGHPRDANLPNTAEIIGDPKRFFESPLAFDGETGVFRYSGGGYMIAQLWAEDVSGIDFAQLANQTLLEPLGMTQSTFAQPIDAVPDAPGPIIGADAGFDPTQAAFASIQDSWHNYPEQAAAGLWTSARDYALFAEALVGAAQGESHAISKDVASAMVSVQAETGWDGGPQHYGLGVMLDVDESGAVTHVSHTGANFGYRAYFLVRLDRPSEPGKIVVSMANKGNAEPLNRAIGRGLTGN